MQAPARNDNWTGLLRTIRIGAAATRCANQVRDRLYLSDYWTARNPEEVERLGITHVVSIMEGCPVIPTTILSQNRVWINIMDTSETEILIHLESTTEFIKKALEEDENNKVLVHCLQGISRSATVVCAYLIATEGMGSQEAIDHLQTIRHVVCPNLGFRLQLLKYSERFPKPKKPTMLDRCKRALSFSKGSAEGNTSATTVTTVTAAVASPESSSEGVALNEVVEVKTKGGDTDPVVVVPPVVAPAMSVV
ncbi:protein-tyrosine phosphatase-like protein [Coprinopsis sp. MPI-PUGE-AT-0042]|nr:protein-tyrosine phosphatase-like protein [Coprinopsis sp. MPI-PUGE-AT-0042]